MNDEDSAKRIKPTLRLFRLIVISTPQGSNNHAVNILSFRFETSRARND
jgi:hypothetical protein